MDREISHLDYNLQLCDSCKSTLKLNRLLIVTARKRSLGQGNVFTQVCVSFCSQGVGFPACITGHMTIGVRIQGVSASRDGVCIRGLADPPTQILRDTVNERAVRILLECVLLYNLFPFEVVQKRQIGNCVYYWKTRLLD